MDCRHPDYTLLISSERYSVGRCDFCLNCIIIDTKMQEVRKATDIEKGLVNMVLTQKMEIKEKVYEITMLHNVRVVNYCEVVDYGTKHIQA